MGGKTLFFCLGVLVLFSSTVFAECFLEVKDSACDGEYVDVLVKGSFLVDTLLSSTSMALWYQNCLITGSRTYEVSIDLFEDDYFSSDDFISHFDGYFRTTPDNFDGACREVFFEHVFEGVPLADWAGGIEGSTIELFAECVGDPDEELKTPVQQSTIKNIGFVSGQCFGGPCCDLDSCSFRPNTEVCDSNLQTDYGCPWGSGFGDNVGVSHLDLFCSGSNALCDGVVSWRPWSVKDVCDNTEKCVDDISECQDVSCQSDSECGVDGWVDSSSCSGDDVFQNFRVWDCVNAGTTSSFCSSSDDYRLRENCPGSCANGVCSVECSSDSDCGGSCWFISSEFCFAGNVWDTWRCDKCYNSGTISSFCSFSNVEQERFSCVSTCSGGECSDVVCNSDSDCGVSDWVNSPSCSNDDVFQDYRLYTCNNPGTSSSTCSFSDVFQLRQDCSDTCSAGSCVGVVCSQNSDCGTDQYVGSSSCLSGDVYQDYRTFTCSNPGQPIASCSFSDSQQLKQSCIETCVSGSCSDFVCSSDFDCNSDLFIGVPSCSSGDVWQTFRDYSCSDPGTSSSSCVYSDIFQLKDDCVDCVDGSCVDVVCSSNSDCGFNQYVGFSSCVGVDVWQDFRSFSCSNPGILNSSCSFADNFQLKESCPDVCSGGSCGSIACSGASDCGFDDWVGSMVCGVGNDVFQDFRNYTCNIPGSISSSCSYQDTYLLKQVCPDNLCNQGECLSVACYNDSQCGSDFWLNNQYCDSNNVWDTKTVFDCKFAGSSWSSCSSSDVSMLRFDCPDVCESGSCANIACFTDEDCGTDVWVNSASCQGSEIWQDKTTFICSNPGITSASCSSSTDFVLRDNCQESGFGWSDAYCSGSGVYRKRQKYGGCSSGSCVVQDSFAYEMLNCQGNGCTDGVCDNAVCANFDHTMCGQDQWLDYPYCRGENVYRAVRSFWCFDTVCDYSVYETAYEDCDDSCSIFNAPYCENNDSFHNRSCHTSVCQHQWVSGWPRGSCSSDSVVVNEELKEHCSDSCLDGECYNITCYQASDCGVDGFLSNNTCLGDDIFRSFRRHRCVLGGSISSFCEFDDSFDFIESCSTNCHLGFCSNVTCFVDDECGLLDWVSDPSCINDDVWQDYRSYSCSNPGFLNSSCSFVDNFEFKESCDISCTDGGCENYFSVNAPVVNQRNVELNPVLDVVVVNPFNSSMDVNFYQLFPYDVDNVLSVSGSFFVYDDIDEWFYDNVSQGSNCGPTDFSSEFEGDFFIDVSDGLFYEISANTMSSTFFEDTRFGTYMTDIASCFSEVQLFVFNFSSDDWDLIDQFLSPDCEANCVRDSYHWSSVPDHLTRVWHTCNPVVRINFSEIPVDYRFNGSDFSRVKWHLKSIDMSPSFAACGISGEYLWLNPVVRSSSPAPDHSFIEIPTILGSDSNIQPFYNASFSWDNLSKGVLYKWMVHSSFDGFDKFSDVWSFTTHSQDGSCFYDSECGSDQWLNQPYCLNGSLVQDKGVYQCLNKSTVSSFCDYSVSPEIKDSCLSGCVVDSCIPLNDGSLWISDPNEPQIHKLDDNGLIVKTLDIPTGYAHHLAWDGKYLLYSAMNDRMIYKLSVDGKLVDSFDMPGSCGLGVSWDGSYLWNSNFCTQELFKLNDDGFVADSFAAPDPTLTSLVWNGSLLSYGFGNKQLYSLDSFANVVDSSPFDLLVLEDLAWDGDYLWSTHNVNQEIYRLDPSDFSVVKNISSPDNILGIAWVPEAVSCSSDSDCGVDGFVGSSYCSGDDVSQIFRNFKCFNPGTLDSFCSYNQSLSVRETCSDGCEFGECKGVKCNSSFDCGFDGWVNQPYCSGLDVVQVYQVFTCVDPGSVSSWCYAADDVQTRQSCADTCSNGLCEGVICNLDSDCGFDDWINLPVCNGSDIWQGFREFSCNNAGTNTSYCDHSDVQKLKQTCSACVDASCVDVECFHNLDCGVDEWFGDRYCKNNDVWQYYKKFKCYNKGEFNSYCDSFDVSLLRSDCDVGCVDGDCSLSVCNIDSDCGVDCFVDDLFCSGDDSFRNYRSWSCVDSGSSEAFCKYSDSPQLVSVCVDSCVDGLCTANSCTQHSDCPVDVFVETPYCHNNLVYQVLRDWSCSGSCSFVDVPSFVKNCLDDVCVSGGCVDEEEFIGTDLVVSEFSLQTLNPVVGSDVVVAFEVFNNGNVSLSDVEWKLSNGVGISVSGVVSSLNAGNGITIFKKLVYSSSGSFYLKVTVDPDDKISELDESNNDESFILTI